MKQDLTIVRINFPKKETIAGICSEPNETSKMKRFAKTVKNIFTKSIRCLTEFLICLWIDFLNLLKTTRQDFKLK